MSNFNGLTIILILVCSFTLASGVMPEEMRELIGQLPSIRVVQPAEVFEKEEGAQIVRLIKKDFASGGQISIGLLRTENEESIAWQAVAHSIFEMDLVIFDSKHVDMLLGLLRAACAKNKHWLRYDIPGRWYQPGFVRSRLAYLFFYTKSGVPPRQIPDEIGLRDEPATWLEKHIKPTPRDGRPHEEVLSLADWKLNEPQAGSDVTGSMDREVESGQLPRGSVPHLPGWLTWIAIILVVLGLGVFLHKQRP